jgi:hypothetical protein
MSLCVTCIQTDCSSIYTVAVIDLYVLYKTYENPYLNKFVIDYSFN